MVRMNRFAGCTLALGLVGCYTLHPTGGGVPPVGTEVAFDVNDAGRLALGGQMGPEIKQVEGRLLDQENGEYVVAVSTIRLLRGGEQTWSGEKVRIKTEHVGTAYTRRLSKGRTIALAAVGVGAVALVVTRSLKGSGDEETRVPGDSAQTRRVPQP